ncbi:MAG: cytochrome c551/c552 [Cryomorphaceae bacterium]|jgi:cytochrome c551/c552
MKMPTTLVLLASLSLCLYAFGESKKKKFDPKMGNLTDGDRLHPFCLLESIHPSEIIGVPGKPELKVSAMAFHGDDLYLTVFTPDRTDKAPFLKGEVYKVTGLIGNTDRSKIKAHRIMEDLYEPTAIAIFEGKVYIGEKDKISRLEDKNNDGVYTKDEKIVLIDGISQPNFHTYTVGFQKMIKDGKTYLAGNLTTSILIGGSRDLNITVNPKTKRGSTFLLGPVTGSEKPADVDISYFAGGLRTPNGIGTGPNNEIIVTDNQGVFNPANKFIRLSQGAFYGHYLLKKPNTNIAAFQPEKVDSKLGGSEHQTPATVYLPQGIVHRSPTQPIILQDLKGSLSIYNGQWLVGCHTLGRINRVFMEEVQGTWQGAVFLHSGGHDKEGKKGLTAGPNRIVSGPDGKFYIGQIGHGGMWRFLPKKGEDPKPLYGLQRLSFIDPADVPAGFNEMVAIRDIPGGLEVELFQPITQEALDAIHLDLSQWTYIPTNGYGGRNYGTEKLTATGKTLSSDGKRISLTIPGIRDNSPPFIKNGNYSNKNVGWVIQLKIKELALYKDTAWYTMVKHQGGGSKDVIAVKVDAKREPIAYAKSQHKAVCAACHSIDGTRLVGPSFKGILGRKQNIIRKGETIEIIIDEPYLLRAINEPLAEHPVGYPPAMPNPNLSAEEQKALVKWLKTL